MKLFLTVFYQTASNLIFLCSQESSQATKKLIEWEVAIMKMWAGRVVSIRTFWGAEEATARVVWHHSSSTWSSAILEKTNVSESASARDHNVFSWHQLTISLSGRRSFVKCLFLATFDLGQRWALCNLCPRFTKWWKHSSNCGHP